ncbi:hypothetical protein AMECASPLE_002487 [Ameca splendens]|uniref:Secreted protein n=1 Tax=Ameca splendens TaxID=208324 RepID=A0ABV0ZWF6_9TELE
MKTYMHATLFRYSSLHLCATIGLADKNPKRYIEGFNNNMSNGKGWFALLGMEGSPCLKTDRCGHCSNMQMLHRSVVVKRELSCRFTGRSAFLPLPVVMNFG